MAGVRGNLLERIDVFRVIATERLANPRRDPRMRQRVPGRLGIAGRRLDHLLKDHQHAPSAVHLLRPVGVTEQQILSHGAFVPSPLCPLFDELSGLRIGDR